MRIYLAGCGVGGERAVNKYYSWFKNRLLSYVYDRGQLAHAKKLNKLSKSINNEQKISKD